MLKYFLIAVVFSCATILASAQTTKMNNTVKVPKPEVMVDTSIRVAPTYAYLSINMKRIEGTKMEEILAGKESYWVYDKTGKEIKNGQKLLKRVGGSMEGSAANYLVKIPFRLKTDNNAYTVRFRWESVDGKKVIDIVTES